MTPEQRFTRWVQIALVAFVALFAYYLIADSAMPLTPQARLIRPVVPVAPQVAGRVVAVEVRNNEHVEAGQVLFRIDEAPYQLAVGEAQLNLEQAQRDNKQLDAQIASAQAALVEAQVDAANLQRDVQRYRTLVERKSISRQQLDQTEAEYRAANAQVDAAKAQIQQLRVERGESGEDNLSLRQARNALEQAQLNLDYTQVRADIAGTVSNLQLEPGSYASTGGAVLALVSDMPDLIADFREKSLHLTRVGDKASVVFDALPGRVFNAHVTGTDAGVQDGQLAADGELASPDDSDRWVRDAQRMRLHVILDDSLEQPLPTGARATVQLYPTDNPILDWLGSVQIRLVSLLHYIY
ncbi:HlyD family secretion protein [Phytohalomonas tamaricis]|uniref:HlyD family secretion protein n=1 Tax=Phytohalomonas tamaricis TaxID=2081032 RepID=UPI000D0B2E42|nr:HlyD family secretion protein [Phytohalomonas tamaricis]